MQDLPNTIPDTSTVPPPKFEYNLEALRGYAALLVVFYHVFVNKFSLDPNYSPGEAWGNPFPGHSSVLLFFILSGYVIGITNKKPLVHDNIANYSQKRLIRIYPIYAVSLLITLLFAIGPQPILTIIGNFVFLQNSAVPVIYENNPLWSLNNEMLYYLLFIPLSFFNLNIKWVFIATMAVGVLSSTVLPSPLVSSYSFGFIFWITGLWIAKNSSNSEHYASRHLLIALLFIFLSYEFLNPFLQIPYLLSKKLNLHLIAFPSLGISYADLFELPFYSFMFLCFTNKMGARARVILFSFIMLSFSYFLGFAYKYGTTSPQVKPLLIPVLFLTIGTLIALIVRRNLTTSRPVVLPKLFLKLGGISYGIYIIHFPISNILAHFTFFSGSLLTFCVRLMLDLLLVLGAAYWLEHKMQPWFKNRFGPTVKQPATL